MPQEQESFENKIPCKPSYYICTGALVYIDYYISKPTSKITCSNNITDKCIDIIFYCCFASVWINTITFFYTHSNMFWLFDGYVMQWLDMHDLMSSHWVQFSKSLKLSISKLSAQTLNYAYQVTTLYEIDNCAFFEQLWKYLLFKNNSTIGRLRCRTSLVSP